MNPAVLLSVLMCRRSGAGRVSRRGWEGLCAGRLLPPPGRQPGSGGAGVRELPRVSVPWMAVSGRWWEVCEDSLFKERYGEECWWLLILVPGIFHSSSLSFSPGVCQSAVVDLLRAEPADPGVVPLWWRRTRVERSRTGGDLQRLVGVPRENRTLLKRSHRG